uniref:Uncharacterized protein n=1 Tax=Anguilla anguilla TaxID=7936 RepID=A0A0E9UWP8_ANGAN
MQGQDSESRKENTGIQGGILRNAGNRSVLSVEAPSSGIAAVNIAGGNARWAIRCSGACAV